MRTNKESAPRLLRSGRVLATLVLLGLPTAWVINATARGSDGSTVSVRLISAEPLATEGALCAWMPGQRYTGLAAAQGSATRTATSMRLARAPLGVLGEDLYPTFGSVAVDAVRNEIVVSGAHAGKIMVYDRLANTPPNATFTEPKRTIEGHSARIDRNCGIYVDPRNGDIYATSLDVQDLLVVHPHGTVGDVPPKRTLRTPPRNVSITIDEENQELYLPTQNPPAVVVYRKLAQGTEAALRILQGNRTQLVDPHGIAVDSKNGLLYVGNNTSTSDMDGGWARPTFLAPGNPYPQWQVPNRGDGGRLIVPGTGRFELPAITVYPRTAGGDTPPLRVIKGPRTQFKWIARIDLDIERQELFVANDSDHSILVFRASESGDIAPIRVVKGPRTGLRNPTDVHVDTKNNEIVVANAGNHSMTVYPLTANGDVAPLRTIRSAPAGTLAPMLVGPGALTYDNKRDEILVPN
jgi:DNA-binding beta-propeller fold protein YncE